MLRLKTTAVAILALASNVVFAGTMGPVCVPGNVTVPCNSSAWDFSIQALYLQQNYSGDDFSGFLINKSEFNNNSNSGLPGSATAQSADDPWGWGLKLEGSYHFYTGNDLNLNWYHYNHTSNRDITFPAASAFLDSSLHYFENPILGATRVAKWDAVNLEFGQHVDFGERKNIRFHGGVQYAHINLSGTLNSATSSTTYLSKSMSFNGFGPRVGADMAYNWGNSLAMYAKAATSLLIGSGSFNNTSIGVVNSNTMIPPGVYSGSQTSIVPELEIKLGATYTYAMTHGDLNLDIGWMWINYISALENQSGLFNIIRSNFSVQGPYVGLKWLGNLA